MIDIHAIDGEAELRQLEALQRDVWQMSDVEIIPVRMMHALQFNGSLLLGAFDGARLVGFLLGVLGTRLTTMLPPTPAGAGQHQLYSVIMGVLPGYQNQHVGYRLKLAQRDFARRRGLALVTWTYDPLEGRNAWLNIGRLGAVCGHYLRNFHGEMTGINAGLASDRFYVAWWVGSEHVTGRLAPQRPRPDYAALLAGGAVPLNTPTGGGPGLAIPPAGFVHSDQPLLLAEIPADFQRLKQQDMPLARQWRDHTRRLFEHYFAAGYQVTDFARSDPGRAFYTLERASARTNEVV